MNLSKRTLDAGRVALAAALASLRGHVAERPPGSSRGRPRVLFICGSLNQTTQLHAVARELPEIDAWFTPYYVDGVMETCRKLHLIDMTIAGYPWAKRCFDYLHRNGLAVDYQGKTHQGTYDLVVTCQDAFVPKNVRGTKLILVQEGMIDPEDLMYRVVTRLRFLPRWFASTSATGLSHAYDRFCVASEGFRDVFVEKGCRAERLVVTGMPNFDDVRRYLDNDVPYRNYVLVCTSDSRETFKRHDRPAFIRRALQIAAGRKLIFKLHPNENWERNTREIRGLAPDALVLTSGCAEELVASCDTLIVEFSTLAFVGLLLGKEVFSNYPLGYLKRLLPLQNGSAAKNIARVCREVLGVQDAEGSARPSRGPAAEPRLEVAP